MLGRIARKRWNDRSQPLCAAGGAGRHAWCLEKILHAKWSHLRETAPEPRLALLDMGVLAVVHRAAPAQCDAGGAPPQPGKLKAVRGTRWPRRFVVRI